MGVRSEVSKKNKYWIERERYYELKHFCLQYPIWKKAYLSLDGMARTNWGAVPGGDISDPVAKCAEAREFYYRRMTLVEDAAMKTDPALMNYILEGVTENVPYEVLQARYNIPCGREMYYELYRKFFYILNKDRG